MIKSKQRRLLSNHHNPDRRGYSMERLFPTKTTRSRTLILLKIYHQKAILAASRRMAKNSKKWPELSNERILTNAEILKHRKRDFKVKTANRFIMYLIGIIDRQPKGQWIKRAVMFRIMIRYKTFIMIILRFWKTPDAVSEVLVEPKQAWIMMIFPKTI